MRALTPISIVAIAIATPVAAKQAKIVDPLPSSIIGNVHIAAVDIVAEGKAKDALAHFDAKAAQKHVTDAGVSTVTTDARPDKSTYDALPFAQMLPLVMEDVTREWGLTSGRPIKLTVTLDTLKTANAAAAWLISSNDALAALVEVADYETGEKLGSFYVDVVNAHAGLLGLAIRGSGIREKLAEEFALESSRILTGHKSKKRAS